MRQLMVNRAFQREEHPIYPLHSNAADFNFLLGILKDSQQTEEILVKLQIENRLFDVDVREVAE